MNGAIELKPIISPSKARLRRLAFLSVFLLIAGSGIFLFLDLLWRSNLYGLKFLQLLLFSILFSYLAFGLTVALFGFLSRFNKNKDGIIDASDVELPDALPRTAILFPVYNEDPIRVSAGIRATIESLRETGKLSAFDFFILSDSRDPDKWIQEEIAWMKTCQDLDMTGHLFYRHRRKNEHKKAGNITDFLERWGSRYKYMVIFDADSLMSGRCLTQLVALMEQYPQAGIIQTAPQIVEAETPFARAQQFAMRLYSSVFIAGLNYWQQGEGNYWGHNAIIRMHAFMEHCQLPDLPWREPLGGKILSHDFVEAALIRKAGYEVWLASNMEGSYEETPPDLPEAAQRDRRWCQGNLQHAWLLFARGFHPATRVHLLNGIMSYTSSFFWFCFLVVSTLTVIQFENSELSQLSVPSFMGFLDLSLEIHGLLILCFTACLLFSPKLMALVDLSRDRKRAKQFGGLGRATVGVFIETLFSAIIAPINMVWHARFVVMIPFGKSASWNAQNRDGSSGIRIIDGLKVFGWISLLGLLWACIAYYFSFSFFLWIAPVLLPLILSVPVAVISSKGLKAGSSWRWLWKSPEEVKCPEILRKLDTEIERVKGYFTPGDKKHAYKVIHDPLLNAAHVALELEEDARLQKTMHGQNEAAKPESEYASQDSDWEMMTPEERRELLNSPKVLRKLHWEYYIQHKAS